MNDVSNLEVGFLVYDNQKIIQGTRIVSIDTINNSVTLSGLSPIFDRILAGSNISFEKNPDEFDNRVELLVDVPANYDQNDAIFQIDENGNEISGGIVHEVTEASIFVTDFVRNYFISDENKSSFDTNFSLRKLLPNGNSTVYNGPDSVIEPIYIQKTGELLYFTDFTPIERKEDSLEQIRIILNF